MGLKKCGEGDTILTRRRGNIFFETGGKNRIFVEKLTLSLRSLQGEKVGGLKKKLGEERDLGPPEENFLFRNGWYCISGHLFPGANGGAPIR